MTINLEGVQFSYPTSPQQPVLNIPHWSVSTSEKVFVHGPSGSGKSTFLNVLCGMLCATKGRVSVLEQDLEKMNSRKRDRFRANHIGYVFQQFNLIPYLNAIDNIRLAHHFASKQHAKTRDNEILSLLDSLSIATVDSQKPVSDLSIGQQQRVSIARALINKPQLLIADEPTSSLDQRNRDNFMSILMSLATAHQSTLLFVSHDMSLSQYFDRTEALLNINHASETAQCL